LSGVVPNYFMGYSLIEIPEDHPEDGSPQGMSCSKNVFFKFENVVNCVTILVVIIVIVNFFA